MTLVWLGSKWAWEATRTFERSIHQTAFNPPIWWFKWVVPISAGMIAIQAMTNLVDAVRHLLGAGGKSEPQESE
jgi:TRAP-type C4-dicarboxylate transport system permease small subunit